MRKTLLAMVLVLMLISSPYVVFARNDTGDNLQDQSKATPTVTLIPESTDDTGKQQDSLLNILPQPDELPSGKFYLTPQSEAVKFQNEDYFKSKNPEKWNEFLTKTGRTHGWGVAYANSNKGVYLPDAIGFILMEYKTPEGAQLAVTKYNNVEMFPDSGYEYAEQSSQLGDKSLVYKKIKVVPGGDNTVYYVLDVAYKNIEIQIHGIGFDKYIQPEFMESMAKLVIKKFDPAFKENPLSTPKTITAGTYTVGDQIQPGLYRSVKSDSEYCTWERLKDLNKAKDSTIQSGYGKGQVYLEVMKTDKAFTTSCDLELVTNLAKNPGDYPTTLKPGMYIIGKDIQAGTYKGEVSKEVSDYCYWQQYSHPNVEYNMGYEAKAFTIKVSERNFALKTECDLELVEAFKTNTDIKVTPTPGAKPTPTVKPSPTAKPTATALPSLSDAAKISDLSLSEINADNRLDLKSLLSVKQAGAVNTIAFSEDDRFIASAGDNKEIHVWDLGSNQEVATLKGHNGPVRKIAFSVDNKWMASTGSGKEAYVWNVSTWEKDKVLALKGNGFAVQFLPDGTLVTVDDSATIGYWDVASGSMTKSEKVPTFINPACASSKITSFDTNKAGDMMAASMSCGIGALWQQGSAEKVAFSTSNHQEDLPKAERPAASTFAISDDGKMGIYGMVYYGESNLKLIDIINLEKQTVISSVNPVDRDLTAVAIGPKNDIIFAGVGKKVYAWWPSEFKWGGDNLMALEGNPGKVTALTISSNGTVLASGDYNGNILFWGVKQ